MISKNKLKIVFCICLTFFLAISIFLKNKTDVYFKNQLIFPNVFIDGINVGNKNKNQFFSIFDKKDADLKKIKIEVLFENKKIATFSGKLLKLSLDRETAYLQTFAIGRSSYFFSRVWQQISTIFSLKKYHFSIYLKFNKETIDEFLEKIEEQYNYPARNALFTFKDHRVIAFKKEEFGKEVDRKEFYKNLNLILAEIKKSPKNKVIFLKIKTIKPEITLAKANNFGIEELLGEGKSNFKYSSEERIHNIILASSKFNGVLIQKNKVFSFNETVGDISLHAGYKQAYIIKEGKTVLGDGGGICQVSTTLFRAALNTGLPIIERYPHAYRVSYYENDSKPGFDATAFAPQIDFKIQNNTPAYILIETDIDKINQTLTVRFYGKKDQRLIEISPISIWDISPPPPPLYQEDPTLKKGVVKQIDFPAWGAKTNFSYKVILNKKILFEKDFFSNYKPWRAVFLVGMAD